MDKQKTSQSTIDVITQAYEQCVQLNPENAPAPLREALNSVLNSLEDGTLRAASPLGTGEWEVHPWVKQAILLNFRTNDNQVAGSEGFPAYDKIPLQFQEYTLEAFRRKQTRLVPGALVRRGAYIGPNTVLMPSYVNIGAYVGEGSLIDTWATVGSCAQIGKNVHLSGGVGIGGVLEPLQANPTIIEDNCFIGARSEIVEGVIVEQGAVISMGVYIGQSTRIYDRERDEILYGRVPAGAVVVPGSLPAKNGKYNTYAAIIVKRVDEKTRQKTSLNQLLREIMQNNENHL